MTERARVLKIHENTALLQCIEDSGCDSCSSVFCALKARTFQAAVTADVPVKTGDEVCVFVPPSRAIMAGFFVLIFPLLLFVGAYLAAGNLGGEGAQVAAGVGGLFFGFGLVYLIGRHRPDDLPRIVQVFSGPDLIPAPIHDTSV